MEHEGDDYTNCYWCIQHGNLRIIKGPGGFGSWRPSGDHPNNSIIENGQNTEKSPGDFRRLAVTQSPVKNHQLTLMWKTIMIIMVLTIIPFVIGAFGTVTQGLLKGPEDLEIRGRVEAIKTTTLLRTARILRRFLVTWRYFLSLKLQWKTISVIRKTLEE